MGVTLSFTGRVSSDPVITEHSNGPLTVFTLITNKWIPGSEGKPGREKSSTHRIKAWGRGHAQAFSSRIKNGDLIEFAAEIDYGNYEKDGAKHYTTDFVIPPFENVQRHSQAAKNRTARQDGDQGGGYDD